MAKGAHHAAAFTAFDEAQFEQLLHVLVHALHIAPDPACKLAQGNGMGLIEP